MAITQAHAYDLIGEVQEGGIEASTGAYEAARSGAGRRAPAV